MDQNNKALKISIIGMGALGLLYGGFIAEHDHSSDISFVMDDTRYEKYRETVISYNQVERKFKIEAATKTVPADIVIVAVKYSGLHDSIETIKHCVDDHTVILSVLNGISSEEILGSYFGMEKLIYTVAQGMDAMKFGNNFQFTRMGELHIGSINSLQEKNVDFISHYFDSIQMPYIIEEDILYRMWSKFMLNVGVNQTCMVYNTTYGTTLQKGMENLIMISAMREVVALANKEGIPLTEDDINQYINILSTLSPSGTPSMGQDRINKKHSEVEMFAGTVISLAKKHSLYVPVNEFLYDQVKEIEHSY